MSEKITMERPCFKISLTQLQTLELGRLCVTWGQIDHFLLSTVSDLLAVDKPAGVALMGEMTTGPLVGMLRKSRNRIDDKEIRDLAGRFCDDMGPLIQARNHIMHGIWGWYLPGKSIRKAKPACLYIKEPKKPLYPEKITETANAAAKQSVAINTIWCHVAGSPKPDEATWPRFFWGEHDPHLPKGLRLQSVGRPHRDRHAQD